jgi:hypothetical protein
MKDNVNKKDESYSASFLKASIYVLGLNITLDKIAQAVGKGSGLTYDGSHQENQDQLQQISRISDQIEGRFVALPSHIIEKLKEENPNKDDQINNLNDLWEKKFTEIDKAIAKKILEEREEEERKIQKKQMKESADLASTISGNIEQEKKENADSLKYRIFASLIFSGILDVTDIVGCVFDIFGVNEDFAKAVGEAISDNKVLSFFGDINKAFGVDKFAELVSKFPILNDINQSALEATKTDAFQTFSPLAREALTGDLTELAFKFSSVAHVIMGERGLQINHEKRSEENDIKIREFEEKIREEAKPNTDKIASRAIEIETRFKLDEIYMRNYLRAVCESGEEINDSHKQKLNKLIIRDKDGNECGTLLDKINDATRIGTEGEKLTKIKEILDLVVEDKQRNNMQILDSFREVARERFYRSTNPENNILDQRQEYFDTKIMKGLEDLSDDRKKSIKDLLKEEINTRYPANGQDYMDKIVEISKLSTQEEFANFIKNEFKNHKDFDDIATKVAILSQKDGVASSIILSSYHRVLPNTVISSGDSAGSVVSTTQVKTGAQAAPDTNQTAASAGAGPVVGPATEAVVAAGKGAVKGRVSA